MESNPFDPFQGWTTAPETALNDLRLQQLFQVYVPMHAEARRLHKAFMEAWTDTLELAAAKARNRLRDDPCGDPEKFDEEMEEARRTCNLEAASAASKAAQMTAEDVAAEILSLEPDTAAGVAVKIRAALLDIDNDDPARQPLLAAIQDAERLAGGES